MFYRTAEQGKSAWYSSVATTIGVVQDVIDDIPDQPSFLAACRERRVFTDKELQEHWEWSKTAVRGEFLVVYSLPKRPTLEKLDGIGFVKANNAPRGFMCVTDESFERLPQISNADTRFIVR